MTYLNSKNKLTGPQLKTILARYAAGESANSLAKEFGIHRGTVLYHARKQGVNKGTERGWFRKIDPVQLGHMLQSGDKFSVIAAQFGTTERAVHKATAKRFPHLLSAASRAAIRHEVRAAA